MRRGMISWLLVVLLLPAVATGKEEKPDGAVKLKTHEDIVYCKVGDTELKLDLYRPDNEERLPGVVVIHGGGWKHGNKESMRGVAQQFARNGFVAATVQYRLSPKAKFPAQLEDVKSAVRWMRENAEEHGIIADRIGAAGASAGGHLALMLGLMDKKDGLDGEDNGKHSSKVQCVVNYFGPFDLTRRDWSPQVEPLLLDFLGGTIDEKLTDYKKASPANYVDPNDPPVLTFHGDKDNIVPYGQALLLDETLKKSSVVSELVTMKDDGHGWGGEKLKKTQLLAIQFLRTHLKP